jgi:peptidoglycan/xylan/chitin deacetylase (PgdA/CDA1 family)
VPIALEEAERLLTRRPLVRAVNVHATPPARAAAYTAELERAAEGCGPVDRAGLDSLLDGGLLPHGRPGLLPVLYDGHRDAYEVVLPVLERLGLTAWCFVPTAFLDVPEADQHAWGLRHELYAAPGAPARIAMTWDELRDVVARGHVVAAHTASHCGAADLVDDEAAHRELVAPRRRLQDELGIDPFAVALLWGTPAGRDPVLDARLARAGYRVVFSNAAIQRLAPAAPGAAP